MSTPLPQDGETVDHAHSVQADCPDSTRKADPPKVRPSGFSEATLSFCFDDALAAQSVSRPKVSPSLEDDRRKVEDLLKDAGVTPPSSQLAHHAAQIAAPTTSASQVIVDWARPSGGIMPSGILDRIMKRALDVVLSVIALTFLAPLLGLIALALRLEGGTAFFCQPRVGRARKRFTCIKFRTMRPDAEDRLKLLLACNDAAREEWRLHQKLANDPRVTALGRLLRESSMDELPQIFNVLRGEMSLVGPRPIVAPEIAGYDADRAYFGSAAFDDYASCLPGITGLWQVSGRHRTIYLDRVRLDRQYARTWSFWLDLKIIWKTVGVVLKRSGS